MNDDYDQDPIEDAFWIEAPVGYYDDIDWESVSTVLSDLTIWKLTIEEMVEIAALFDDRRIEYHDGTLTMYGVPRGTGDWFGPWLENKWPEKWGCPLPTDRSIEKMNAHNRLAQFEHELRDVRERVFELLDELDVVEILRAHVPARNRWMLDRLESAVRRVDSLDEAIAYAIWECAPEEGDPPEGLQKSA